MTETKEIYSEKAVGINQAIDKIIKPRIPIISNSRNNEILALLENYKDEQSRNYIQKYAETEMNNFSSKMGKFSLVIAPISLILSFFMFIFSPKNQLNPIELNSIIMKLVMMVLNLVIVADLIILIILIIWLFYIPFEKDLLKTIIMKIEDDKLNRQSGEVKSIIPETEVSGKDLKIKVEKFELNLSISAGK